MIREEFYRPPELLVPAEEFVPLDSTDPIDEPMIAYYDSFKAGEFLDAAEQEMLVRGVRTGDESPAQALTNAYEGLVATVSFPFKGYGLSSSELLRLGNQGLVIAAQAYGRGDVSQFDDKAVYAIEWALSKAVPDAPKTFSDSATDKAMDRVHGFLEGLEPSIRQEALNSRILDEFTPLQRKVLPLLHLGTHEDIAEAIGPPADRIFVNNMTAHVQRAFDLHNTTSVALMLHGRGYQYPVKKPEKPLVELLTDAQFAIGNLLHLEYEDIGSAIGGKTAAQVRSAVNKMRRKTGARSRTELALMIAMFDTGERRDPEAVLQRRLGELAARVGLESLDFEQAEELVGELEPEQAEPLASFYLTGRETSWAETAGELDISKKTAERRAEKGVAHLKAQAP